MKTKLLICLAALLAVAATDGVKRLSTLPKVRVTARVVDEQGGAMSGALVSFVFGAPNDAKAIVKIEGVTQSNGLFTGEGYSDGSYGAAITKEGFYRSGLGADPTKGIVDGHWEPWNKTYNAVLRPIVNPVAFYAKRVQVDIPVLDQPCGYDLEKGDWVAPHGKGAKTDFFFKAHREFKNRNDFDIRVEMVFPNRGDGLLKTEPPAIGRYSSFKWDREAPQDGYVQSTELRNAATAAAVIHSFERTDTFFFRVRTVEENGRIIAANYGKISGGLRLDGMNSKTCTILFTYYLNPTSLDRNMEWDPKRNLLKDLSWEDNPREP